MGSDGIFWLINLLKMNKTKTLFSILSTRGLNNDFVRFSNQNKYCTLKKRIIIAKVDHIFSHVGGLKMLIFLEYINK